MEFRFAKPPGMTFKAGQYLDLTLLSPPETDDEGNSRSYSICAAPDDEELAIATRLRNSAFKRCLQKMPMGTGIQVEGPYGDFTLHRDPERPAVLLAGGIGVTPFRSMVRQYVHRGSTRRILLARDNPNFTFVPTMSRPEGSRLPWDGEVGRIEFDLITRHLRDGADDATSSPIFYIAGPPGMVGDLRAMLTDADVSEDDIRIEEFSGY